MATLICWNNVLVWESSYVYISFRLSFVRATFGKHLPASILFGGMKDNTYRSNTRVQNGLLQQCQLWKAHRNPLMGMWFIDTYQWDRENWNVDLTNSDRSWKRLDTAKIKFRNHMHGRSFRGKPHPKHLSVSKNRDFIRLLYMYHFVYVTVNKCVIFAHI